MKRIVLILLFFTVSIVFSQENETPKKDLKVGLVLAGGGAKGFVHIGILKALEEAGVRIDYIGGTSMGAIIGALYASGYNANQLDSIVKSIDFVKLMLDDIPRESKPFYEKSNGEKYVIAFPMNNGKIGLPQALSKGQNVLNLVTELLQHTDTISDFSKLPIPFVCIATNLETGKQEVLSKGFLPKAVRASGSFPTLLNPVEIDGKMLVDGGIVNNFPVDEVREMGADIIIGVDLKSDFYTKDQLNSVVDILDQIIGFQMYGNHQDVVDKTDIYIHPNLEGYNVTSFDKYDEILRIGEVVGGMRRHEFKAIANQQIKKSVSFVRKKRPKKLFIKSIKIDGNQDYTRAYIKGKMDVKLNDSISFTDFTDGINNLSATENFSSIQYQIDNEVDGNVVRLGLKQDGTSTYMKFAIHYDNLYKTGVLVNLTSKHLLVKNDILSADLILGDELRFNFDYFIDNGSDWSFGFKSRYNEFESSLAYNDNGIKSINMEYIDVTNQLYFQTVLNRKFALGIGAEHKYLNVYTKTFIEDIDMDRTKFDDAHYLNFISYLKLDSYDKKFFQKKGLYADLNFRWYLFSSDYLNNFNSFSQFRAKLGYAQSFLNNKLTAHFNAETGLTIGSNENISLDYHLGGYGENYINTFVPFYGYSLGGVSDKGTSNFLKSGLTFRYEFIKNHYFMATGNFASLGEGLYDDNVIFDNIKSGYGIGYGIDSFLGPIELNYTWSPDTNDSFMYFNLGFWF